MTDFPYTQNTGKLKEFLKTIRGIGVPTTGATQDWFQSIGFKSSNDRPILRVMRFIGFIDSTSKPTDLWMQYRGPDHQEILAKGIIQGYKDLFDVYPDAYSRSSKELEHYFTQKSTAGKRVIDNTIATFKTLCELAEFNGTTPQHDEPKPQDGASVGEQLAKSRDLIKNQAKGSSITMNINIQLTLPDTTDATVYDNFFAAMKKHIFQP
jgi:hypothetical protein